MFWERNRIESQKNDDIESTSCNMLRELFSFFNSSLSSSSSVVTQWVLKMNSNLLCLTWLSSLINFALSLATVMKCLTCSLTINFNSDFSFLWIWLRDLRKMSTQEWSQWVHLTHFRWSVITMQEMSRDRQWSQKMNDEFLWRSISLKRTRWFFDLKSILELKETFRLILSLIYDLEN